MKEKFKFYFNVIKDSVTTFINSNALRDSASLAYSAIFSIPGLLIIIIWLAGFFFGEEAIQGEISRQISDAMGRDAAKSIEEMITGALIDKDNFFMKAIGVGGLIFGATTLFFLLQKSLNDLWGIQTTPKRAIVKFLTDRAYSLGLILVIGFLMVISMILSSLISWLNFFITNEFGFKTYQLMQAVNFTAGFALVMVIFAIMFKVLPDVEIPWKAVWVGSFITAILFTIGKVLISFYFGQFKPTSAYGTAGTILLIMMWVNYSFLIIFFGAAFTKVNAIKRGMHFSPSDHADWKPGEDLDEEIRKDHEKELARK